MKHKIIIADDSQTIQKVIKITLANEDYELVECLSADKLIDLVSDLEPTLVLLDFNLSENKTGYDLAKEIKDISAPKIMMLYGTFDSIDESLLDEAGVNSHIVKPFDGNKFITTCRQMVEDSQLDEESDGESTKLLNLEEFEAEELEEFDENVQENSSPEETSENTATDQQDDVEIEEEWVVNQPEVEDKSANEAEETYEDENLASKEEINTLEAGMKDWGIDVPGVIGESEAGMELPPVIGGDDEAEQFVMSKPKDVSAESQITNEAKELEDLEVSDEVNESTQSEIILPQDQDLEYPDEIVQNTQEEITIEKNNSEVDEKEILDGPREISLESTLGTNTKEEVEKIEQQIADEVGHNEALWQADEVIEEKNEESVSQENDIQAAIDKARKSASPTQEETAASEQDQSSTHQPTTLELDESQVNQQVEKLLEPLVERMVREKIDAILEKVSWEVIPDLAENLIRKELKEISNDILNSDNN
ncbi:MAG: response regulator [Bacteriovoracaceae bacterium]|jgi:DNA-binding response OmpR family regulator|nr:hypothetical protein [Halobacteriovoraceae bacterium]MDP7321697.1 response regulator [Bacteriovoracaceae bacterium]